MNTDIKFKYDGIYYVVDKSAEQINYIALPDGRILHVEGWLEIAPPYPRALSEVVPNNMVKTVPADYWKDAE